MLDRTLTFGRFSLDPRGALMSGARRVGFYDLSAKCGMNAGQPIPRIRNDGAALEIVCYLIADQIGMVHEKRGRQKGPADFVSATEKIFGRQQQDRAQNRAAGEIYSIASAASQSGMLTMPSTVENRISAACIASMCSRMRSSIA